MKILLIAPPVSRIKGNISGVYPLPPLGLAYIASVLEKNNFKVDILDMPALKMGTGDLPGYLKAAGCSIYGLSCNLFNLKAGIEISGLIRAINPKATIVAGGRCNSFPPEILLKYGKDFDLIVKGEGEETMLALCNMLKGGDEKWRHLPGIAFRDNGGVAVNPQAPYADFDKLPLPARHLLPNKNYRMHPPFGIYPPVTIVETSRGCAYNCTFCNLSQPVRERRAANVLEEIKELANGFKIREVHFVDPNFTYHEARITDLCERLLKDDVRIAWTCKTRVDLVSKDLLKIMSRAGCYMISYGVESGSQEILDRLNKNITLAQTIEAFNLTRKARIRTIAYVLLGSPNENENTVRDTVKLVQRISPDFALYGELLPDPSSSLVKQAVKEGSLSYEDIADFYITGRNIFSEKTIAGTAKSDSRRWMSYANKAFYIRISYVLRRLLKLKNLRDLFNMAEGAYFMVRDKLKRSEFV